MAEWLYRCSTVGVALSLLRDNVRQLGRVNGCFFAIFEPRAAFFLGQLLALYRHTRCSPAELGLCSTVQSEFCRRHVFGSIIDHPHRAPQAVAFKTGPAHPPQKISQRAARDKWLRGNPRGRNKWLQRTSASRRCARGWRQGVPGVQNNCSIAPCAGDARLRTAALGVRHATRALIRWSAGRSPRVSATRRPRRGRRPRATGLSTS